MKIWGSALALVFAGIVVACSDNKNNGVLPDGGEEDAGDVDAAAEDAAKDSAADVARDGGTDADASTDAAVDATDAQITDAKAEASDGSFDASPGACATGAHSIGPLQPTAVIDLAGVGTISWANVSNARVSDDFAASVSAMSSAQVTHYLVVSSFGFNVPAQATITGVSVGIERKTNNGIVDNEVRLLSGAIGGDNKASASTWPASDTVATYGGASDKWGLTLTPNDVNGSSFGAALSAKYTPVSGNGSPAVDQIRMTVFYSCP